MGRGKTLNDVEKCKIQIYHKKGYSKGQIAILINRSLHVVKNFLKDPNNYGKKRKGGLVTATTPAECSLILEESQHSGKCTAREIATKVGTSASLRTVRRIISNGPHYREKMFGMEELGSNESFLYSEPPRRDERRRKIWKNDQMEAALAAIKNHEMGYHKAAKHFGVPRTTLFRLSKRNCDSTDDEKGLFLPPDMEEILINHLLQMEQEQSGLTRKDVMRIICEFAADNIPNPFINNIITGKGWLKRFLKRHAGRLSLHKTTELPALNCVDLFPNPPKYVEADLDQTSKDKTFIECNIDSNESISKSIENEQEFINQFIDDDENTNDSLDKFEKELETEKDHPEVTEEDLEKIAKPEETEKVDECSEEVAEEEEEVQTTADINEDNTPPCTATDVVEEEKEKEKENTTTAVEEALNESQLQENSNPIQSVVAVNEEKPTDAKVEDKTLQKANASLPASSPSLSISSYYSSGDCESTSSLTSLKKKKRKRHCYTCDIHFRHTHELLTHLKNHVTQPSVTVTKLSDENEHVVDYLEKQREYPKEPEEQVSLKLKLKLSGTQNFEVVKSPTTEKPPKNRGIRILTAKEIKQSPPHNAQVQPIDAMVAMSEMPMKPVEDSNPLENRYFECPTLDGLDQYADEIHGEATEDLLKKLLESGQHIPQEVDWSPNTNEFIPIDRLAHMCTVCHCNFPDAVQLYEHKRMTGHDFHNSMQPPGVPPMFMPPNNYRPRMNYHPNQMPMGPYQHPGQMGQLMRPPYSGYPPPRFPPVGPNYAQQAMIARRPPPLYRGPSPQNSPSPVNHNQFGDMNPDMYSPHGNGMLNNPAFQNNQMQSRQPVFLKTRLQRAIRPRTPLLQGSSPNGTPSPPIVMAPPTAVRPRFLGPPYTGPMGPPAKKVKREPDDDCEIVSPTPRMDGFPVIQSVQGGVPQPQSNDKDKEAPIQLNDQITLSLKNREVNKNPKEVASILANRGITVTHKTKQTPINETSPKNTTAQEAVQKLQLNNSVSIISKKKPDSLEDSSIPKIRAGDSSFISCPFTDCEEKFLTIEGLNRHTQRGHRMNKANLKAFRCKVCPALFSTQEGLMDHQRKNHRILKTSADELGIPIIDLRNEQTKQKLASLGIINYIPLNSKTANGCFGFPIVSVQGAANPNVCNMMGLGVNSLLSLGPIKPIPSRKNES